MYQGLTSDELESEGLEFLTFLVNEQRYQLSIKSLEGLFGFPVERELNPSSRGKS